jgi:CrcB protein
VFGILGGYTTFSAFAIENVQFLENGNYASFLLYSVLSFTLCIGAALLGYYIGK